MKNAWIPLAAASALAIGIYAYMAWLSSAEQLDPQTVSQMSIAQQLDLQTLTRNAADAWYNQLVEAFRAGQLSLKKEVPPGLAELANPYDPASNARYRTAPYDVLDLSYYKGRFYLYFGVTPALLLFWPFVALTGDCLSDQQAVAIFCSGGFLACVGLLCALWRRYFSEVGAPAVVMCVLALGLGTGVPVLLSRPQVYQVAVSCGYMLTMLALAAMWCALHEPNRRGRWLAAASVAYGLAVGARPSLLFGAVILLVPVIQSWREGRQIWVQLLAATGPIMLIGVGLMIYNALRFDNPFEFGVHYMVSAGSRPFSLSYVWFNFRVQFLEPARWSSRFPFVNHITVPPLPAGYCAVEDAFGVLTNIPLVWLALAVPLAWRSRSADAAAILRRFVMALTLIFGICALTVCLFWAAFFRYEVDFLPALTLLAVVGILGLERWLAPKTPESNPDRWRWRLATRLGGGLLLGFSVAFNLLVSVKNYAQTYDLLGVCLGKAGRVQEAVEHFEQALRICPDFPQALNNLGNTLSQAGKVQDAIEHYEQALRLKPDYAEAHNNLAVAFEQLGKVPQAIQHYEQALQINPDLIYVQSNLAWLLATRTPSDGGDPGRALTLAQEICQRTGHRVVVYLDTLAVAYAANGRFDDAIATSQQAIEYARSAGQIQLVSQIEARLQLYRAGRAYHESAIVTSPNEP